MSEGLDVVVLPSICPESIGLVVAEALSRGRPMMSTRFGGPEDQIKDGADGWSVGPTEPVALSQRMGQLASTTSLVNAAAPNSKVERTCGQYLNEIERIHEFY